MAWRKDMAGHLGHSARERLMQTPVRVAMGLIIAWFMHAVGADAAVVPWLIVSTLVQLAEYAAMRPFRRPQGGETRHVLPALASVTLFSTVFSVGVLIIWRQADPATAAAVVMALGGTLISNVASGRGSRLLFALGAAPYMAALLALPFVAPPQATGGLAPLVATVILFVLAILAIWMRLFTTHAAMARARQDAETRLAQAEAAMADRAAMAAIVSHELRTPVSAILAGAHVIRQGGRPEQAAETAELIVDAGRLMTGMLNDLLDHSKIEARGMTLEARDFDLRAFMADTERFWRPQVEQKGLTLEIEAPGEALWLKGDPFRLRQIVNNLLSNAVKFTPAGRIAIAARTEPLADGAARLNLSVLDQGPGVSAEAMDKLFTPFAQGSSEVARTYGGTGLGLTVSRELARLMGGDLTVDSGAGRDDVPRGARFVLDVRLDAGAPVEQADPYDAPAPAAAARLRVLAVDDHEINRRTLALVLQPLDVALTTASDGETALKALAGQAFDLVLMDVNMPGIDGNETTRRLRASGGINAGIPVIGFSAGTERAQIDACRSAGMTDWLPKPLEPRRLYEALERAMTAAPSPERLTA